MAARGGDITGVVLLLLSQHIQQNTLLDTDQKKKNNNKKILPGAYYLRGLLHLSNSPKIRGRCPDLCGKAVGVGAHSMTTVGRKFWNLHGN